MSGRKARSGRKGPRALHRASRAREPDLMADVRETLDAGHPLPLLVLASSLLAAAEPVPSFAQPDDQGPTLQDLVGSFVAVPCGETTALLTAFAELVTDEFLERRIRRELASREDRLPGWLEDLERVEVEGTLVATHILGDMDILGVEARTGTGAVFTVVVYVDHDLGTVATDGFCYPGPVAAVVDQLVDLNDPDLDISEIAPADARARIDEAVQAGRITLPPYETDTWPASRALVEWVTRAMPEAGSGYERPEFDEERQAEIAERFFASPHGRAHDHRDGQDLLESLLWYGCDYGTGDPLTWSGTAVEVLLLDWLPRKIVADVELLGLAPDLLRSFIRFAHDERGIRDEVTAGTLAVVDELAPEYQRIIRNPRPQGPAALMAAMGMIDEDEAIASGPFGWTGSGSEWAGPGSEWAGPGSPFVNLYRDVLERLRWTVGGGEALAALSVEPLPDEPFGWERLPDDIHGKVADVLDLLDRCAAELLDDVEYRTAFRRFLADVAAADPEIFRRRGRADTAAAAIVWAVGKANDLFDSHGDGLSIGEMTDWFGVSSSPSQRADTMLRALGVDRWDPYGGTHLGTPRYLVSGRRRAITERRDHAERELGPEGSATTGAWAGPIADEDPWDEDPWDEDHWGVDAWGDDAFDGAGEQDPWGADPFDPIELGVDPAPASPWAPRDAADVLAVGWFPPDAFGGAVARWPELVQRVATDDYAAYARVVQATLLDVSREYGERPVLVALDPDEVEAFADEVGLDPGDRRTRAALAVEIVDRGDTHPWPPGRNDPCWCGSGRKYKRCCDTVPLDPERREVPQRSDAVQAYEFDVDLVGARPRVWRRIRLAADGTFRDLHDAIQDACGWYGQHLFAFTTPDGSVVAGSGFDGGFGDPDPDARDVPLASYFGRRDRCRYEYDFGDGWIHEIVLRERITEPIDHQRRLIDGARAFPPEDCGGMPGYARAVAVATGDEDDEEFSEWLGDWHPDGFDLEEVRGYFDR